MPDAKVLGVTRESSGLLLELPYGSAEASDMDEWEKQLLRAGASSWHWTVHARGVRIRAHWHRSGRMWPLLAVLAITAVTTFIANDIHLTKVARDWIGV